jgi:hypothetical protein
MEAWLRDTIKALAALPPEADLDYNVTDAERFVVEKHNEGG